MRKRSERSKDQKIHPEPAETEPEADIEDPEVSKKEEEPVKSEVEAEVKAEVEPKKETKKLTKKFMRFNSTAFDSGRGKKYYKPDSPRKWGDSCFLRPYPNSF
jgi:hypothetical protein